MKKKMRKIEITELFLVRTDWERTYVGIITRNECDDGSIRVHGKIPVEDFIILASAPNENILANKLDEFITLMLEHNIMEIFPPFVATQTINPCVEGLIFREYLN